MNNKNRRAILFSGLIILIAVLIPAAIMILTDRKYSSGLPDYPDLNLLSEPLRVQITEAGKKARRKPSSENLGMMGMVYHSSAFYEKAAVCYELAAGRKSKGTNWNYYLGYLNLELGESKKALENFNKVIEAEPENILAWYYYGEAFQNSGMQDKAENIFRQIVSFNEAEVNSASTLRKNSYSVQTYAKFQLARIQMETNRPDSAEKNLMQIIEKNITFGPAYRLLGNLYASRGDKVMSKKYTDLANDMAIYSPPSDPIIDRLTFISRSDQYLLKQIDVAVQSLDPGYTIELLNNALKYFPDNKFLVSKAVSLFLLMSNGKSVLPYLEKHRYMFRDDYKELLDVADLLYDNGYRTEAIQYFDAAKKAEPNNPETQSQLAKWLMERGMNTEASELITEQLKADPHNKNVLVDAVYIFLINGKISQAKPLLSELDRIDPSDALTIKMKAILAEKEGDLNNAIGLYKKSFLTNPGDMSTIKYLGMILMREERWKDALDLFRKGLEHHPNEPYLLEVMGRILVTCPDKGFRNLTEGKELSQRAFYRFTSTPLTQISAGINLSLAYAEEGDRKNASEWINKTLTLARKANVSKEYMAYIEGLSKKFSLPF